MVNMSIGCVIKLGHNGLELGAVLLDNLNYSPEHCAKLMMCEVREAASTSLAELQPDVAKGAKRISPHRWRYEKLPIAGDFLSSYTKVEAGYNP